MSQSQLPGAYPEEDNPEGPGKEEGEPAGGSGISLREKEKSSAGEEGQAPQGDGAEPNRAEPNGIVGEEQKKEDDLEVEEGNEEAEEEEKVAPPPANDLPQLLGYELLASSFGVGE